MFSPVLLQLQDFVQWPKSNPVVVILMVGLIVLGIVFFLIVNARSERTPGSGARLTRRRFNAVARRFGLDAVYSRTLLNLIEKYRTPSPYAIFANGAVLDSLLQKGIAEINQQAQSDAVKEAHKATLFRIKQLIEQNSHKEGLSASSQLQSGQQIKVTGPDGKSFDTKVTTNLRDYIAVAVPLDEQGTQVRWKKWATVQVFSFKPNGQGFSFETKIAGYSAVRGAESLLLQHTSDVRQAAQRRYRRKSLEKSAYYYPVQVMVTGSGRDARKRAVVQAKGALGTVLDVSGGGCSIKTMLPLAKGALVKVQFETERSIQVIVYGKVKNVRRTKPMGAIMHVMFTQVSKQHLNRINSYVYEIR